MNIKDREVVIGKITYIVNNNIIIGVKAPLNIDGAGNILYNIGKNINNLIDS